MNTPCRQLLILSFALFLANCGGSSGGNGASSSSSSTSSTSSSSSSSTGGTSVEKIKINQVGYMTQGEKFAIVPDTAFTTFELVSTADDSVAYSGNLSGVMQWTPSGGVRFRQANFSLFSTPGEYFIQVEGVGQSDTFEIGDEVYGELHDAVLKAYYYNRSSTALDASHAGQWARAEGHPDTNVLVHSSAASDSRPEGEIISSPKGWYDAGDFGKYTVNSGISVFTMLAAYEHFPDFYADRDINIPETGSGMPDILNEAKWNLDWLATMQDEDGGVYHKLTTLNFAGAQMPSTATQPRYVIGKGTAATLDFAAMMAQASRVYEAFDLALAEDWLAQAEDAWDWAQAHPNVAYSNPADVNTGEYGDSSFADERAWAAAELFLATGEMSYYTAFTNAGVSPNVPGWPNVHALSYISLVANASTNGLSVPVNEGLRNQLISVADGIVSQYQSSAYVVPMVDEDFYWGSNSVAANKGMILMQAYRETDDTDYRDAAQAVVSYLLGRNPTDYSFVTGFGHKPPMGIHHRQSQADGITEPVPGFLAGGPHNGRQDGCSYPSNDNARSYLDDWCSYSTNEVTINWNAPLLYVLAALLAE